MSLSGQAVVKLHAVIKEGPPAFALPKFVFPRREDEPVSKALGRAKAVSVDQLTYSIHKGNDDGLFQIDSRNGELTVTRPLDAEIKTKHLIYVRATDLSARFAESSVEVTVENINDNRPKFRNTAANNNDLIEVIVPRDSPVNAVIVKVDGYDEDIGDSVQYSIVGNARTLFQIGPTSGVVRSLKELTDVAVGDNVYTFQVKATDTGNLETTVQVRLLLVNREAGEEIRSVSEAVKLTDQSIIRKVGGRYLQSRFRIVYPDGNPFDIDSSSGNLRVLRKLDFETRKEYTIFIEEMNTADAQDYITYEVRIRVTDENDNDPVFTMSEASLYGKVNRNAQLGTVVMQITVQDADSGDAGTIDLQLEPDTVPFSIDPFSSEITTSSWDITEPWYNISIIATDRGKPRRSTKQQIHIRTGANPPEFDRQLYQFEVSENSEPGDFIGKISARSLSGLPVRFEIESGNQRNLFSIGSQGELKLQHGLDYESGSAVFNLIVVAKEHSKDPLESRVTVAVRVINENDNAPEFTTFSYSPPRPISEDLAIGTTILTVTATDKDCGQLGKCAGGLLTYSMADGAGVGTDGNDNRYQDIFKVNNLLFYLFIYFFYYYFYFKRYSILSTFTTKW